MKRENAIASEEDGTAKDFSTSPAVLGLNSLKEGVVLRAPNVPCGGGLNCSDSNLTCVCY